MALASATEARRTASDVGGRSESDEPGLFDSGVLISSRFVIPAASTTIPPRRVGRTIARNDLRAEASRKVRAPQRRVAGNARPPRGEDQCHRDVARAGLSPNRDVKRGKLCSEQGQIGGRGSGARATGRPGGRGRAAQSSGRPLELSGNRRPEMDDRHCDLSCGTELGLQAGSPPILSSGVRSRPPRRRREAGRKPRAANPRRV